MSANSLFENCFFFFCDHQFIPNPFWTNKEWNCSFQNNSRVRLLPTDTIQFNHYYIVLQYNSLWNSRPWGPDLSIQGFREFFAKSRNMCMFIAFSPKLHLLSLIYLLLFQFVWKICNFSLCHKIELYRGINQPYFWKYIALRI